MATREATQARSEFRRSFETLRVSFGFRQVPLVGDEFRGRRVATIRAKEVAQDLYLRVYWGESFLAEGGLLRQVVVCEAFTQDSGSEDHVSDAAAIGVNADGNLRYWDTNRGGTWLDFLVDEAHDRAAGTEDLRPFTRLINAALA
jgi:hypothetical protein